MISVAIALFLHVGNAEQPIFGYSEASPIIIGAINIGGTDLHGNPLLLRGDAAHALRLMREAAHDSGLKINCNFAFRTMEQQISLKRRSPRFANPPGLSSHQEGIAIDVSGTIKKQRRKKIKTPLYKWLHTHAQEFGFYQTSKKEPWHWVYLGDIDDNS